MLVLMLVLMAASDGDGDFFLVGCGPKSMPFSLLPPPATHTHHKAVFGLRQIMAPRGQDDAWHSNVRQTMAPKGHDNAWQYKMR